jgi:hypothetical protein
MNKLNEVFDVEEVKKTEVITVNNEVILPEHKEVNERIEYDYDKTRNNLHSLLQSGQDALQHALEVAKSSEHPRAFEVVGNLVKQLADVNQQLLELHKKKQSLDKPENNKSEGESKTITNNNAIFVGSTSELNKLIKNMNTGE